MKRLKKAIPFIALVLAAVVIPVLATTFSNGGTSAVPSTASEINLDLVLLVNRMELTKDQMQALHDILVDLAGQREALQTALEEKRVAFETEMLAFSGTSEELGTRLEAYRTELRELVESRRDAAAAAYEKLGDLLTYNQGMLLEQVLPRLDGSLTGDLRGQARIAEMGRGARLQSMMQGPSQTSAPLGSEQTPPAGMSGESNQAQLGQVGTEAGQVPNPLQFGARNGQGCAMPGQTANGSGFQRMGAMPQNGLQILEELIRVLELKLSQA
ncbi:MAG: hypothetical protein NTY63_03465 [Candidatus Bipolaricaulota bacterium]|nr:hypothetical protein [Candidatus Bipolaricaulota bacterium]